MRNTGIKRQTLSEKQNKSHTGIKLYIKDGRPCGPSVQKNRKAQTPPQSFQTLARLTTDWHLGRADTCSNSYWCVVEVYPAGGAGGVKDHGGKTLPTEVPPVSYSSANRARDNRHAFKFSKTSRSVEGKVGYRRMTVV